MRGVVGEGATRPGRGPDDVAFGLPSRHRRLGVAARLTPLALVVPPLLAFILANPPAELMASLVPALALFVAIAVWTVVAPAGALSRRALVATILLTLLAVVVILLDPTSHWLILFAYPAVAAGLVGSVRRASVAIVAVALIAGVVGWPVMADPANRIERPFEWALIGFAILTGMRLVIVNNRLADARAEIARLAAADERLRIARDLHDLLGHGLSVIALKAELAGRLLPGDPTRAAAELADIEGFSRRALGDVRAAVSGYRHLDLDGELVGARATLEAAGVATEVDHQAGRLPPQTDEIFAWSLREGVTNVIRHARASGVVIRTRRTDLEASLEILDDGPPSRAQSPVLADPGTGPGSGLAGLAERARAVGGRVEAAPRPGGGFRLAVTVPIPAAAA
jgi:two-component system sensor histidine kinase DesK